MVLKCIIITMVKLCYCSFTINNVVTVIKPWFSFVKGCQAVVPLKVTF